MKLPPSATPNIGAEQAAERIRAWHDALRSISAVAEAQVMECAAAIRRDYPDREDFHYFVLRKLDGVLDPEKAWLLAETWELSSDHRRLRDLALARPREAMEFARAVTDAGTGAREFLDDHDLEIAEILEEPPRARLFRLRELLAARDVPEPVSGPAPEPEPAPEADPWPGRAFFSQLQTVERAAAALPDALAGAGALNQSQRDYALRLVDIAVGKLDEVSDILQGTEEA